MLKKKNEQLLRTMKVFYKVIKKYIYKYNTTTKK